MFSTYLTSSFHFTSDIPDCLRSLANPRTLRSLDLTLTNKSNSPPLEDLLAEVLTDLASMSMDSTHKNFHRPHHHHHHNDHITVISSVSEDSYQRKPPSIPSTTTTKAVAMNASNLNQRRVSIPSSYNVSNIRHALTSVVNASLSTTSSSSTSSSSSSIASSVVYSTNAFASLTELSLDSSHLQHVNPQGRAKLLDVLGRNLVSLSFSGLSPPGTVLPHNTTYFHTQLVLIFQKILTYIYHRLFIILFHTIHTNTSSPIPFRLSLSLLLAGVFSILSSRCPNLTRLRVDRATSEQDLSTFQSTKITELELCRANFLLCPGSLNGLGALKKLRYSASFRCDSAHMEGIVGAAPPTLEYLSLEVSSTCVNPVLHAISRRYGLMRRDSSQLDLIQLPFHCVSPFINSTIF